VLLAARAAIAWEGWSAAERLLAGASWLDGAFGGEGRALLARARLEQSNPSALRDAEAAVRTAGEGASLGSRLVLLARALDRADRLDSAALVYRAAAVRLPAIADWLSLRAAGVATDAGTRETLRRAVSLTAAVPRVPWTEALALERAGSLAAAARLYDSLGSSYNALALRLRAATDPASRDSLQQALVAALRPRLAAADTRRAIVLLDSAFAPHRAVDELLIARRAAAIGLHARAVTGFSRGASSHLLTDNDRYAWGTSLARLGRHAEAIVQFGRVAGARRSEAQYQRARSLLRTGKRVSALSVLRRLLNAGADTATSATAGYLLANLHEDAKDDAEARRIYREIARRYPSTPHAPRAAFQAALISYVLNDATTAAREFAALADRQGSRSEGPAARYWAGRAAGAAGSPAAARDHWQALLEKFPDSYYVIPAAMRLDVPVPEPPGDGAPLTGSEFGSALDRAELLDRLGLGFEARLERDHVARTAERSIPSLAEAARAFAARGHSGRALRLAQRARDRGAPLDGGLARLLYPLPVANELELEARRLGVDPLLAAGLIRQESGFDPAARSVADARGLMQVMPSLGAAFAAREQLPGWDPVLLFQPDLNVHFGLAHLATVLRRYDRVEHALAAYNAGGTPVRGWLELTGTRADPEVFIERIPYVETRDYVRIVLRNREIYRVLYPEVREAVTGHCPNSRPSSLGRIDRFTGSSPVLHAASPSTSTGLRPSPRSCRTPTAPSRLLSLIPSAFRISGW
jgi:soluble lytic murein transglycosylase